MPQGLAETPALPPPPEIRVPRRVTALDRNCPFQRHLLQAQPGEMRFRSGWPVDRGKQKGVPPSAPRPVGPVAGGDGVPSGRACRRTLIPPSGQLPRKPMSCTGWWFMAEKLLRKVKDLQPRPGGGAPEPL